MHLISLLKSPKKKNDRYYAVSDYRKIDVVVNHTADDHAWAKEAKTGNKEYQDYYYTDRDQAVPNLFEHGIPEVFPEIAPSNFTLNKEMQ